MKQNIPLILGIVALFSIIVIVGVLVAGNLQKKSQESIMPVPVEKKASSTTYSTTVDFSNNQPGATPSATISPTSGLDFTTGTPVISPTSGSNNPLVAGSTGPTLTVSPTITISPTEIPLIVTSNPSISPVISPTKKVVAALPKTGWGQATMAMIGFAGALVLFSFIF